MNEGNGDSEEATPVATPRLGAGLGLGITMRPSTDGTAGLVPDSPVNRPPPQFFFLSRRITLCPPELL